MRISCPYCGARDSREFTYLGSASLSHRPAATASAQAFHDYVNIRENPAGPHAGLWLHSKGCSAWLEVVRDTVTHEITWVQLAGETHK